MRGQAHTGSVGVGLCALALLSGCAGDGPSLPKISSLNPFAEKQVALPGKRIPVMEAQGLETGELAEAFAPITLPAPRVNDNWAQPGGEPSNAPGNLAFNGGTNVVWSASIGTGSGSSGRLTARPIVFGGHVFAIDADGTVSAFATSGGSAVWRTALKPKREGGGSWFSFGGGSSGGGFGGGLAADGGRLYAATGYGNVVAIDPQNGKVLWEKQLEAPVRSSPTAVGDRVFVITLDGRFFCLAGADGGELWSVRGLPQQASLINNASPAVEGDVVVVPYPSGDLMAMKASDGSSMWSESLTRTRTTSQVASMSDAARPAIDNGTVFAIGHAGRMIATQAESGERLWSINLPGTQTPWVAGGSVFVADTQGQLVALSRQDGKTQWTVKLPGNGAWAGPTLAGGTLWLTSSAGSLVGVEATTGRVVGQKELGGAFYIAPIVAQGRMYVINDDAKLMAIN
ncbi:MAG: PQQ-binding-like beta-propeller repeat protein [Hyphomicrobium sp.]